MALKSVGTRHRWGCHVHRADTGVKNSTLAWPNVSMSSQLSPPHITAQNVSSRISGKRYNFLRSIRRSSNCPNKPKKPISSAENLGNGAVAKWRFLVPDSHNTGWVFAAKRRKSPRHCDTASSHARAYVSTPGRVETRWRGRIRTAEGNSCQLIFRIEIG